MITIDMYFLNLIDRLTSYLKIVSIAKKMHFYPCTKCTVPLVLSSLWHKQDQLQYNLWLKANWPKLVLPKKQGVFQIDNNSSEFLSYLIQKSKWLF